MPASSAEPLITSLNVGTGNGLGLSIGSGYEWAAFARKLASPQAIFVYEPDCALVHMVLEVCDLADALAAGKIIIVSGPAELVAAEMSEFLAKHIGFEPPTVMQPLATIPLGGRNALLAAGEMIVRRAVIERQGAINALARRVEAMMNQLSESTVIFALRPRYDGERLLIQANPGAAGTFFVDDHASASIAVRLRAIADHRPRKIISDLFRDQIGCVPPTIAVETWIAPLIGPAFWDRLPPASGMAPHDRIIVHGGSQQNRLVEHGIPKCQVELRPMPRSQISFAKPAFALAHRVAIIADLSSIDPKSLNIELPTHLAVFSAAMELIAEEYLSAHVGAASDILRRALIRAAVSTTADGAVDPALREPMLRLVRDILIPTVPLLTLAQHLIAQHIPLRLIGDWQGLEVPAGDAVVVQQFPVCASGGACERVHWEDVAILVHLSPSGMISPLLWEAVGAGVPIVSPKHATDVQGGALATVLKPESQYAHPARQQFVATVKALLRDGGRRASLAAAAGVSVKNAS